MEDFPTRIRSEIRQAFARGEAVKSLLLVPPTAPPAGARLGALITAAAASPVLRWQENAAEVRAAVASRLDRAEALAREYESAIRDLERVADHMDGDPLGDDLSADLSMAARLLAGSPDGLAAARSIRADLERAKRRLDECRSELRRAKSAGAVAVAGWIRNYVDQIGLDGQALGLDAVWKSAVASHRVLLAERKRTRASGRIAA
ncbi:hypothetical protein J5Y09_24045 [Roseomonas sp. PWR1]|uniref:Uncharacterized protein n=1 Tax=Roseomonas nitratireducens TaxID=2820810 RepID=A0ABS4B089_9PROT|nr:hypothetical protein [Neoroseomonas nitratireducens]MBP0467016.1 hypothetical protein [Neoroseomonas nitratireducens]